MKTLLVVALVVWLLLSLVGALIEGLLWLTGIALLLLLATAAYGWLRLRRTGPEPRDGV